MLAIGGSLTAVTVIVTVAVLESSAPLGAPSLTLNVKVSDPLKFRFGV